MRSGEEGSAGNPLTLSLNPPHAFLFALIGKSIKPTSLESWV
jgi:hypothetical protein